MGRLSGAIDDSNRCRAVMKPATGSGTSKFPADLWDACGVLAPEYSGYSSVLQILVYALPLNLGSLDAVWPYLSGDERARPSAMAVNLMVCASPSREPS
jgi:hypothetical protein